MSNRTGYLWRHTYNHFRIHRAYRLEGSNGSNFTPSFRVQPDPPVKAGLWFLKTLEIADNFSGDIDAGGTFEFFKTRVGVDFDD